MAKCPTARPTKQLSRTQRKSDRKLGKKHARVLTKRAAIKTGFIKQLSHNPTPDEVANGMHPDTVLIG